MADMNSRGNRSYFSLPPALCLRFPALRTCTEDPPLTLRRLDNFQLVMGILDEINQDIARSVDSATVSLSEIPRQQVLQSSALREVKVESIEVEDEHRLLDNLDLNQEWTLKGVEELLRESNELHVRSDCYQFAEAAASDLDACVQDEKPSHLQPVNFQFEPSALDQDDSLVDEKPLLQSPVATSLLDQISFRRKYLSDAEAHKSKEGLHSLEAVELTNSNPLDQHNTVVHSRSNACEEDLQPNGSNMAKVLKVEPEAHVCSGEAETQERRSLQGTSAIQNAASLAPKMKNTLQDSNSKQPKDNHALGSGRSRVLDIAAEPEFFRKDSSSSHKLQLVLDKANPAVREGVQPAGEHKRKRSLRMRRQSHFDPNKAKLLLGNILPLPTYEPKLHLADKKRLSAHDFLRSTNSSLGSLSALVPSASTMRMAPLRKEADSQLHMCEMTALRLDPSEAECDRGGMMVSSASVQSVSVDVSHTILSGNRTTGMDCSVKRDDVRHCRRTDPNQWGPIHATRRYDLKGACKGNVQATPLETTQCAGSPPSCGYAMVDLNGGGSTREALGSTPQVGKHQNSPTKGILEHNGQDASNDGELAGNFFSPGLGRGEIASKDDLLAVPGSSEVVEGLCEQPSDSSPQTEQASQAREKRLMGKLPMEGRKKGDAQLSYGNPQAKKASPPEKRMRGALSVEDKHDGDAQPSKVVTDMSAKLSRDDKVSDVELQPETAGGLDGPPKKRMRGTLPVQDVEKTGEDQADSKRCHRSDGKSWRCARECINGHYYCQYHLRARRIGYNRRKARDKDLAQ